MSYWLTASVYSIGQSITENYTNVRCDLYFDRDSGGAYSNYTTYGYITIDGQRQDFSIGSYGTSSRILLGTRDFRVYHNADGSKSVNFYCYFNADNAPYVAELSTSGTTALPTIPRAAPISAVNFSNIYSAFNVTYSSYSSSFNYKLRVSIPGVVALETYSSYASGTSKAFTAERQKYLVDYLLKNNKTSAELGFVIETYNGATKIGESTEVKKTFIKPLESVISSFSVSNIDTSVTFNLSKTTYWSYYDHTLEITYGPLKLYSGPFATSVTVSDSGIMNSLYTAMKNVVSGTIFYAYLNTKYGSYTVGTSFKNATGTLININPTLRADLSYYDFESYVTNVTGNNQIIVQNLSGLNFRIPRAIPQKNAEIVSYRINYNGGSFTFTEMAEWPYGTVAKTGTQIATLVVTDSRGRTVSSSVSITVTPYSYPSLSWDYYRANKDGVKSLIGGTCIFVKPVFSVASVAGNAVSATVLEIDGNVVSRGFTSNVGVVYGKENYTINNSYPLKITITDKFNNSTSLTGMITVSELPFNITKDKTGVGIGTVAVRNQITFGKNFVANGAGIVNGLFTAKGNANVVGTLNAGTLQVGSVDIRLKMFPVNSIYLTYTNINPGTFLGGTWVLIGQDRFIVGAGSSYSGGATGGSSTTGGTALTNAQLPALSGAFTPHGAEDGSSFWQPSGVFAGSSINGSYYRVPTARSGGATSISQFKFSIGGGSTHAHSFTPSYIALYIWRRTA